MKELALEQVLERLSNTWGSINHLEKLMPDLTHLPMPMQRGLESARSLTQAQLLLAREMADNMGVANSPEIVAALLTVIAANYAESNRPYVGRAAG